jgi:cytochrome c551/c552
VINMARTFADKEQAAAEIAKRLANRDLDETAWRDAASLREIAGAFADQVAAERRVAEAVRVARAEGCSWSAIAAMLGVSKQTAAERYG